MMPPGYWKAIRRRAGVSEDYELTIANTNLDKEANVVSGTVYGDLAVFSGRPKSRQQHSTTSVANAVANLSRKVCVGTT